MSYISQQDYEAVIAKTKLLVTARTRQAIVPVVVFMLASIIWHRSYPHYLDRQTFILSGIALLVIFGCIATPWFLVVYREITPFCPNCPKCETTLYPGDLKKLLTSNTCPKCKEEIHT